MQMITRMWSVGFCLEDEFSFANPADVVRISSTWKNNFVGQKVRTFTLNNGLKKNISHCFIFYILIFPRYELMVKCWEKNPEDRPTFTEVVMTLESILGIQEDYLTPKSYNNYLDVVS